MQGLPTEHIALLGRIAPQSATAAQSSGWTPAANYSTYLGVLSIGGTADTVNFKVERAKDASGTGAEDLPDHAITQIAALDAPNKDVLINIRNRKVGDGFTHIRITATPGGATLISGLLFGVGPGHAGGGVALPNQSASVEEIVSVTP